MQRKEGRGDEGTRGRGEAASEVGSEGARELRGSEGSWKGGRNGARAATSQRSSGSYSHTDRLRSMPLPDIAS